MLLHTHRIQVDWIELELTLPRPSNAKSVKSEVDALTKRDHYVKAVNCGPGGAATIFLFRLQDPPFLRSLWKKIEGIWPGCSAAITGLEIALDTYIQGAGTQELAECLYEQFKWMEFASAGQWHLYRRPGEKARKLAEQENFSGIDLVEAFAEQWQLADYNKKWSEVPHRFHLHVKTTDYNKRPLPPKLWRARFEITLQRESLPWTNLADLATADFTALRSWFRFRRQNPRALPHLARALSSRGLPASFQPGRAGSYRRPPRTGGVRRSGKPNRFRSFATADSKLNEAVYDQLRRLRGHLDP